MPAPRVVYDCNVLLQALISPDGPAGRCLTFAFEGRVLLFCSEVVFRELWDVASRSSLRSRFTQLTDERLDAFVEAIEAVASFCSDVREVFVGCRDRDDDHYVNLAIATGATRIVTRDQDLLDLMDPECVGGRPFRQRFPMLQVIDPVSFARELGSQ